MLLVLQIFCLLVSALMRVSVREVLARYSELWCRCTQSPASACWAPLLRFCPRCCQCCLCQGSLGGTGCGIPSSRCVASAVPPVLSAPCKARPAQGLSCSLPRSHHWSPVLGFAKLITEPRKREMEHFLKALFGNNFHITRKRVMTLNSH